jgi:phosphatidylglycerophosphate synthase
MPDAASRRLAARWIGWSPTRVWGLTPPQRLWRSLHRAGVSDCADWTGTVPPGAVLLFLGDTIYDDDLVQALAHAGPCLVMAEGRPVAAHAPSEMADEVAKAMYDGDLPNIPHVSPEHLTGPYRSKLRKRAKPVVLTLTDTNRRQAEDLLFGASYKGVTDVVTKYVWPLPAKAVTRWCAALHVSPNTVTLLSLLLAVLAVLWFLDGRLWPGLAAAWGMTFLDTVDGKLTLAAFWLFWQGQFGWGLLCAWIMTFLDTVDGKLARVTLTSSRVGDVLDHGLDLIHPPFWWWAWWGGTGGSAEALAVVVAGYVLLRLQEGFFIKTFGIELHVWRQFDSLFRLVTARRNPILVILTVGLLLDAPAAAFTVVAAWTLVSLAVHAIRIGMALKQRQEGGRIVSWLEG